MSTDLRDRLVASLATVDEDKERTLGKGIVADYGAFGLDFYGPKECPSCKGSGREAALAARPEPEGVEPVAWRVKDSTSNAWALCHSEGRAKFISMGTNALIEPLYAGPDVSRLLAENAGLKARLAEVEAEKAETRKILVRCHDRIHALPRTSDTDLAVAIERLLGRIARGGRHEG